MPSPPVQPPTGIERRTSPERADEDLLLMLLYLLATRGEELDRARCRRLALDLLLQRLEAAGLITIHKRCYMFTEEGEIVADDLLTEFCLDRFGEPF